MKRFLSVLLILTLLYSVACADNLAETIELYNENTNFTGVPKINTLPTDGTYLCLETGMLLMFIKSETSDDISLVGCYTFGRPDGEAFLCTVCNILNMYDPNNTILNYGRLLHSFMVARNTGAVIIRTSNNLVCNITYTKDQYKFYLELK